jgi:plastocyanin
VAARRVTIAAGALVLLALLAALALPACSKKSSPAAPSTGGGGGTESFDSGIFSSGVFVHAFNTAGDFGYHCRIHGSATGGMRGSVHVATGLADSATVTIGNNSYSPTPVNVKPNGYVKWVANGTSHSVTTP